MMALATVVSSGVARSDVPLVNLEGQGGVAFNPLAYPAWQEGVQAGPLEIGKPRIGAWYVNLNSSSIDWPTIGIAAAFNKRLEVSFGYEAVAIGSVYNAHKENFGAKLLLLEENAFGTRFLPAIAVGSQWKRTTFPVAAPARNNGFDFYAVATKMVTELPMPVLLSAGALTTKGMVNGVLGFNAERKFAFFGNADVVPVSWLAVGFEYKMGANYGQLGGGYVDADYYDVHAAWFVTKSLTMVTAYARAGAKPNPSLPTTTSNPVGFGSGLVVSGQYAF
jgi:hypothetical protein